jgi:hypothetical protein
MPKRYLLYLMAVVVAMLGVVTSQTVTTRGDDTPPEVTTTDTSSTTTTDETTITESTVPDVTDAQQQALHRRQVSSLKRDISFLKQRTWHWQYISFVPLTPGVALEKRSNDTQYLRWRVKVWGIRRDKSRAYAFNPPHKAQWLCIHYGEGSWSDSGSPFWGGLQMDLSFQRTYGYRFLKYQGTADHWSPLEQMWAAEYALRHGKTFHAWPTTAKNCGYI